MAEQLRELMTRLADEAGPAPADPLLWQRARRSRRRNRFLIGAAVAVTALSVTGVTLLGADALRDAVPPADAPTQRPDPGIPSDVQAPSKTAGLSSSMTWLWVAPQWRSPTTPPRSWSPRTTGSTTDSTCRASTRRCMTPAVRRCPG